MRSKIDKMFGGVHLNTTEDRAVLHAALRAPRGAVRLHLAAARCTPRTCCNTLHAPAWPSGLGAPLSVRSTCFTSCH